MQAEFAPSEDESAKRESGVAMDPVTRQFMPR